MTLATTSSSGASVAVHGWVAVVIITASVIAALAVIGRLTAAIAKRILHVAEVVPVVEKLVSAAPTIDQLVSISHQLNRLVKEFDPNGGSTLRDAVDHANKGVEAANHGITELHEALTAHAEADLKVQAQLFTAINAPKA